MRNSERLQANILAAEIAGTAYSFERLVIIEPTPYTEAIQDDKLLDYMAAMTAKLQQLNAIIAGHFNDKEKWLVKSGQ
jgi:hypothetical protein